MTGRSPSGGEAIPRGRTRQPPYRSGGHGRRDPRSHAHRGPARARHRDGRRRGRRHQRAPARQADPARPPGAGDPRRRPDVRGRVADGRRRGGARPPPRRPRGLLPQRARGLRRPPAACPTPRRCGSSPGTSAPRSSSRTSPSSTARPVPIAPRTVLAGVVERARALGFEPACALELEFQLLRETRDTLRGKGAAELELPARHPTTYGVHGAALSEPVVGPIRDAMRAYGLPLGACNPESAPGQFEINLRHDAAVSAADHAVLFKTGVKELVAPQDLTATFMAKPHPDWAGNSLPRAREPVARRRERLPRRGRAGRHVAGDAPLRRRRAGDDGRADRAVRPDHQLVQAPSALLVGGDDGHVGDREPHRRPAGDLRGRRDAPRAAPGRRRRQPLPGHGGRAGRRPARHRARDRAAALHRRRRLRARARRGPGAARVAGRGHRPARGERGRAPPTSGTTSSSTSSPRGATSWRRRRAR